MTTQRLGLTDHPRLASPKSTGITQQLMVPTTGSPESADVPVKSTDLSPAAIGPSARDLLLERREFARSYQGFVTVFGTERSETGGCYWADQSGGMLWLRWNALSGSTRAFTLTRRSQFGPYAARTAPAP